mgnify:CR=1 FL=1
MEKEREENTYPQGHEKEKDLVYQKGKQGLKLCGFISNRTIIVFVQMTINGFCWNIVQPCDFIIS